MNTDFFHLRIYHIDINCPIDPTVKAEVEAIYSQYGMSITDAIKVFLYQSRNVGGLPFDLRPSIPNAKTIAAMKEADLITNDPNAKRYADFSEILTEVEDEI